MITKSERQSARRVAINAFYRMNCNKQWAQQKADAHQKAANEATSKDARQYAQIMADTYKELAS